MNNPTLKTSYSTHLLEGTSPTTVFRGWVYYTNLNEGHTTHEQEGTPCSDAYKAFKNICSLCIFCTLKIIYWASLEVQMVKNLPKIREIQV